MVSRQLPDHHGELASCRWRQVDCPFRGWVWKNEPIRRRAGELADHSILQRYSSRYAAFSTMAVAPSTCIALPAKTLSEPSEEVFHMKPKEVKYAGGTAEIAAEAYIYGYPLVIADITRRVMTAVPKVDGAMKAPINQFVHTRAFPDYTFTDVVSPNADTLYSLAWLDISMEPMILSIPEMGNRYYLMPMLDAWTNVFASPGTRTTGNGKGDFAIVGPQWTGRLPEGVREINSPTKVVWLVGRTETNGKHDYAAVHAIQDQYLLTPLGDWDSPYMTPAEVRVDPGIDTKTPPVEQVARMDASTFFGRLNGLMKGNPPAPADAPALARFAKIGVAPGQPFDPKNMDQAVVKDIEQGVRNGLGQLLADAKKSHGANVNGWDVPPSNTAAFGTDYSQRAIVAHLGLGANLPADAIYPHAIADAEGKPLTGANRYVVSFPKSGLPPVNAFWSLTMYNAMQAFVQNPIGRYAIGDRDGLKPNPDGSLTLYVQHDSPGKDK